MKKVPKVLQDYFTERARKAGSVTSEAKAEAARRNGRLGGRRKQKGKR